jgi:DNA-binding NarL/FixJ family response regulator
LPRGARVAGSASSASRPRSFAWEAARSNSDRARSSSPAIARHSTSQKVASRKAPPSPFPELSRRERDVLDLIAAGRSNPDIALRLSLSEKTVRNNVSTVLAKLRVADRSAAIVLAREAGITVARSPEGR